MCALARTCCSAGLTEYSPFALHILARDQTVADYKRRPIMSLDERVAVVEACRYVDEVVPEAPLKLTEAYLTKHRIDLVVHGDDISPESEQQMYSVPKQLGKYKTIPYTKGVSTSDVIRRIRSRDESELKSQQKTTLPSS